MTLSPYALLKSAKPKPPKVVTTPYDHQSMAQQNFPESAPPTAIRPAHESRHMFSVPSQRTHYISEIHARHTHANQNTHQQPVSL